MNIAVIGAGRVGSALGVGWAKRGHEVVFGVREPDSDEANALAREAKVKVVSIEDAANAVEVVALAIPWAVVENVLHAIAPLLKGKLLIDCTNPTGANWPRMEHAGRSGGERVAELLPDTCVVKCFNTTGFENMQDPHYPEGALTMFYAGDDAMSKKTVHQLAIDLGFDAVDTGELSQSHTLEVLASLWGTLAYGRTMGRDIGFRLLRR